MKSEFSKPSRNETVDIIRGIAMLMVVLGHTVTGCSTEYENTFLFKIIWTLQMPLFFIVSGYVTRYSRPMHTAADLGRFLRKRTFAYLLPWLVWTLAVRGALFGQHSFFNFRYLLWHMDSGYWFLVSLWSIVVLFGVADYLAGRFSRATGTPNILLHLLFVLAGGAALAAVGYLAGMSFLCIKLTLYYIPLYLFGYLFGQYQERLTAHARWQTTSQWIASLALVVWLYTMLHFSFYGAEMSSAMLALRYISSVAASIFVIYLISSIKRGGVFVLAGRYSLEIYLVHYLLLKTIPLTTVPVLVSVQGLLILLLEYALTVGMVAVTIYSIRKLPILSKALFHR